MSEENVEDKLDTNEQIAQRKAKLTELREQGNAYPNVFKRDSYAAELHAHFEPLSKEELAILAELKDSEIGDEDE